MKCPSFLFSQQKQLNLVLGLRNRLAKTITVYLFGPECIPLNEKWQKSFKADDNIDANNYRPISLLFKFNRIFEKLVFTRVKTFIKQNSLLSRSQYGFRKVHSTRHSILDIVNIILANMDKRFFSYGVYIFLKKVGYQS